VMLPSPAVVEMCGYAGFGFVILDREHGAAGMETLENQVRAADAAGIPAIVRVPSRAPDNILHAMDAGANGILVPHVITAEDAEAAVRAAHFPPRGSRGMTTTSRAGRHGLASPADYMARARSETVVICQIEDGAALQNVTAIARIPDLDAMFVGPADLSTSLGHPGEPAHPEVVAAVDRIRLEVESAGGPALANFARTESDAASLVARGFPIVCLSSSAVFSRRLADLVAGLKR
ncbi:partial 5-keto-4-deoxy-D-glucarate aldolase, partial [Gammaproteobacteria bacterium]